ncbi:hypothetical protein CMQ_4924 [Grosmannia clavigera kw1407]|uniref:Uncharacterized protein n=1 Tax=Grosmannia clavigera (strain kw1407 / UAMH 11150) TaxID=655863 RepID=F0XK05_GROCL|nr:uncharacterized protein CMQ_4924 [Grosmannia clavigera kw1407]EFX01853.1 hypothetical protein CMQ_4924 [Grosmannia clavigera kw1407]
MAGCSCETRREIWTVCAHTKVTTELCWQPGNRDCARAHKFDMHIGWCAACEDYYGSNLLRRDGSVISFWRCLERLQVRTPMFIGFVSPETLAGDEYGTSRQVPVAPCEAFKFALGNMMRRTGDGREATRVAMGRTDLEGGGPDEGIDHTRYAAYMESVSVIMTLTLDWAHANVMREVDVDPYATFDMVQMYQQADEVSDRSPSSSETESFPVLGDEDEDECESERERGRSAHSDRRISVGSTYWEPGS